VLPLDENIEVEPENGKVLEYGDVETSKWNDSPTTPKASSSSYLSKLFYFIKVFF
jgi:Ni,Fe-hydrogenase I large subunit